MTMKDAQAKEYIGKWKIVYSNNAVRVYDIDKNFKVTFPGEGKVGKLFLDKEAKMLCIFFENDNRIESVEIKDKKLNLKHFNPKSDFPEGKPAVTGIGAKIK